MSSHPGVNRCGLPLGWEVLPPPLQSDPPPVATGTSLVKGGHEPRTATLTGQGSTPSNRGALGGAPAPPGGSWAQRAVSQWDHLGEEATGNSHGRGLRAVSEEGKPTSVHGRREDARLAARTV